MLHQLRVATLTTFAVASAQSAAIGAGSPPGAGTGLRPRPRPRGALVATLATLMPVVYLHKLAFTILLAAQVPAFGQQYAARAYAALGQAIQKLLV